MLLVAPPNSPTRTLPILLHTLTVSASRALCSQLNLHDNRIGSEGAKSLADALKVNASLTSVDLSRNSVKDVDVSAICEAVQRNKECKLAALNLMNIGIGPDGAKAVAALCSVSASLTQLDLSGNELGPEGAKALAPGLVSASLTQVLAFCQYPQACLPDSH